MQQSYDVIIAGGGLAGLTLSIQLKQSNPNINILILEKRKGSAAIAAHKVGESSVELGSHYLREVLGLKDYLEAHELPKHGLRFFFKSHNKAEITSRVELGPRQWLKTPSHQLDRGTFENYLTEKTIALGTQLQLDARVTDISIEAGNNSVTYLANGIQQTAHATWIVDAASRINLLKKKLNFQKPMEHHCNAVWWRIKGVIDIDNWSENEQWKNYLVSGLRYLSTVHFMDKGYWVWIIPLGTKNTSIGIVADPAVHPFETFNTYEAAIEWLRINEPLCHQKLAPEKENVLDFKILRHFAHHSERLYDGVEKWATTGESGAFLDPLYSPGTDLISLSNTLLSDLILRDKNGEDVSIRAEIYEQTYLGLIDSWIPIYQNKYLLMGSSQIMVFKIFWDWAVYWAVPTLLFTNKAFTDLRLLKQLFATPDSLGRKLGKLGNNVQQLFLDWLPYENEIFEHKFIDPYDLEILRNFQQDLDVLHGNELIEKVAANMQLLEKFAAEIFRHVSAQVKGTGMDIKVNPYEMKLDPESKLPPTEIADEQNVAPDFAIRKDVATMWFYGEKVTA